MKSMSASRWNSNILNLLKMFEEDDLTLNDLLMRSIRVTGGEDEALEDQGVLKVSQEDDIPPEFTGSVLDLLRQKNELMLTSSRCEISAIGVEPEIAKMMNIQRDDAVLEFKSLLFSADGTPVDFSYSYFLPGYFRFRVIRRVGSKNIINE